MNTIAMPYRPKSCAGCEKALGKTSKAYPVTTRTNHFSPARFFVFTFPLCSACYNNNRLSAAVCRKAREWILTHPDESMLDYAQRCHVCRADFGRVPVAQTLFNRHTGELRCVCAACEGKGSPPSDAAGGSAAA